MARMVRLIVTYDMDDLEKSLEAERMDWLRGHVSMQDMLDDQGEPCEASVTIEEVEA